MSSSLSKPTVRLGGVAKKIESPLAKYNSAGQLTCILCNIVVKSEMVWTAHINGRQHREQVTALKKPKAEPQFAKPQALTAVKRKAEPIISEHSNGSSPSPSPSKKGVPADFFDNSVTMVTSTAPPKQIKSILKNASKPQPMPQIFKKEVTTEVGDSDMEMENIGDVTFQPNQTSFEKSSENPGISAINASSSSLPEGFFDDPKLDAKVRHIEFKDPVEEEWNKFQKEIHDEVNASVAIQEEDQEESTAERQLEEIEEQMLKWGRVLQLEQKKEMYTQRIQALRQTMPMEEGNSSSSDDETEMDKFFDWRSKAT